MNFKAASGVLRHLVSQLPRRMVGITEQLRPPRAQLRHARDEVACVVSIAALRPIPRFLEERLACRPNAERSKVRLLRRVLERENIALLLAALRALRRGGDLRVAQTGKRTFVRSSKSPVFGSVEKLCRKGVRERRDFLVQFLQFGLVRIRKICTQTRTNLS